MQMWSRKKSPLKAFLTSGCDLSKKWFSVICSVWYLVVSVIIIFKLKIMKSFISLFIHFKPFMSQHKAIYSLIQYESYFRKSSFLKLPMAFHHEILAVTSKMCSFNLRQTFKCIINQPVSHWKRGSQVQIY